MIPWALEMARAPNATDTKTDALAYLNAEFEDAGMRKGGRERHPCR
jgi:hypothetical protein